MLEKRWIKLNKHNTKKSYHTFMLDGNKAVSKGKNFTNI